MAKKIVTQRVVTKEDLQYLKIFWETKEDIERYVGYEEIVLDLELNYPDIVKAWKKHKKSFKKMKDVLTEAEINFNE